MREVKDRFWEESEGRTFCTMWVEVSNPRVDGHKLCVKTEEVAGSAREIVVEKGKVRSRNPSRGIVPSISTTVSTQLLKLGGRTDRLPS